MKKLLFMAALALPAVAFTACSDNDEMLPYRVGGEDTTSLDYFYREHCYGYKVKDTASLRVMGYSSLNDTVYLSGTRNGRLWIAGFDYDSKEQISEFVDSKPLELEYRIDLGYGDSKDVTIDYIDVEYLVVP